MARYVITPDVVEQGSQVARDVSLVAPTLFRSQVLILLYRRVVAGEMERDAARQHLDAMGWRCHSRPSSANGRRLRWTVDPASVTLG